MYGFLIGLMATAGMLALMGVSELVAPIDRHSLRSKLPGFVFSLVNAAIATELFLALRWGWSQLHVQPIVRIPTVGWFGDVAAVILSLLVYDLCSYWNHRFQHRFLWRIHVLHHCQTELHANNSYGHFSELGFRFLLFAIPLSLIRFDFPPTPFIIIGLREVLELWIHSPTEFNLGPLRRLVVDNRYHRIHHSLQPAHFDKNFGIMFSFWDRIFGTQHWPKPGEWPATGVEGVRPPRSIFECLTFPSREISMAPIARLWKLLWPTLLSSRVLRRRHSKLD